MMVTDQTILFSTTRTPRRILCAISTHVFLGAVIYGAPRTAEAVDNSVEKSQEKK
jgi:hypothetical protein